MLEKRQEIARKVRQTMPKMDSNRFLRCVVVIEFNRLLLSNLSGVVEFSAFRIASCNLFIYLFILENEHNFQVRDTNF